MTTAPSAVVPRIRRGWFWGGVIGSPRGHELQRGRELEEEEGSLAASAPEAGLALPGGVAGPKMRETHCWRAEREASWREIPEA